MNKKIYGILNNYVNSYTSTVGNEIDSNIAIFRIFDSFFQTIKNDKKLEKTSGIEVISGFVNNVLTNSYNVMENSFSTEGCSFLFKFDGVLYTIRFKKFRQGDQMYHQIYITSAMGVKYSSKFMYKYLLFNALETSNLKGAYFSMPRDQFSWDIKNIENRTFNDIYLPEEITLDLNLYVDIYKNHDRILRYLKVGNPGTCKTESTIVIANELNKLGVTIIKTPICRNLHDKVELANVLAPALIIFDDIDLSLGDRNKGAYSQLLGDFLDVLDGTDKLSDDVGVIATTNAAHLLDLAAQRPGRFDKTLLFDDINHENIKNIILKSLRNNFKLTKGKEVALYSDSKIVDKFYDAGVSGSHIYNGIKMLKLRYDTLKIPNITVAKIIKSIDSDIVTIQKIRKVSFLKEKFDRENGGIGFKRGSDVDDDEEVPEGLEVTEKQEENSIKRGYGNGDREDNIGFGSGSN